MTAIIPTPFAWPQDRVAARFSRAAPRYAQHAGAQARVAEALLSGLAFNGRVMDLGCGTGRESRRLLAMPAVSCVLAVDLADGMLRQLPQDARLQPIQADAAALPLPAGRVDAVFSNFALQWCADRAALCHELARVLKRGGSLHVSVPGPGSLAALQRAGVHVNRFASIAEWQAALQAAGFVDVDITPFGVAEHVASAGELLRATRQIGANQHDTGMSPGLKGRRWLQQVLARLEDEREPEGFPLRYEALLIRASRG